MNRISTPSIPCLMRKCQRKLSNPIKDFQHKLSWRMVDNTKANTLIIGNLNVKKMPKSSQVTKGLNRSTQNHGYMARFARFLAYKCRLAGKKVIWISEANISSICCACGKLHRMPLSRRSMGCDCGNLIDRDRNSAVNIMVRLLSQNAMWTGYGICG